MKKLVILVSCLIALYSCSKQERPNVILILTDDQGYGDIGAHGNPYVKTPTLDLLHEQSIRLTNFHVDPCCTPSRAALLTGQYSMRSGVWHTIGGRSLLGSNNKTIAEVFRDAGYHTAIFGKWHLGENTPFRPMDRGFTHSLIHGGGVIGANPDLSTNDYFDDTYLLNGIPTAYSGYCNTVWFEEAYRYIDSMQHEPFFCFVSTNVPHAPLRVDSQYIEPYRSLVSDQLASYYGMITKMDEDLDNFLAKLKKQNILENTILLFMTDNGPCPWFGGIIIDEDGFPIEGYSCGMRGGKIWGYENAHRVPCFISWPAGDIGGGVDVPSLSAHFDLLPTLMDWCKIEDPEVLNLDGYSLDPWIRNPLKPDTGRFLIVHNQRVDDPVYGKDYQVLTDQWRLVKRTGLELYDIQKDPEQRQDLANSKPSLVAELDNLYHQWWKSLGDDIARYNPIILGSEQQNPAKIFSHDAHRRKGEPHFYVVDLAQSGYYSFKAFLQAEEQNGDLGNRGISSLNIQVENQATQVFDLDGSIQYPKVKLELESGPTKLKIWYQKDKQILNPHSILVTFEGVP